MSRKSKFLGSLVCILAHNRDGARRSQSDRGESLKKILKNLYESGYQLEHVKYIKQRHIKFLVAQWKESGTVSAGAMKNRMSHLRWLMEKVNKPGIVPSNDALGIPKRVYAHHIDKSRDLSGEDLKKITHEHMRLSLLGQKLFGLRLMESLKIQPFLADQGTTLFLKWTKGGRERTVPILTDEQRKWLDDCKALVKHKSSSMIPDGERYRSYRSAFEKRLGRKGISKRHGLRHLYAQKRFEELAGFPCPLKGGPYWDEMSAAQRASDKQARLQVSLDLGHSRSNITNTYLSSSRRKK